MFRRVYFSRVCPAHAPRRIQLRSLTVDPGSKFKIRALLQTKDASEVLKILERAKAPLSQFDVVISLYRLGKFCVPGECPNIVFSSLYADLEKGIVAMVNLDERDLANVAWALAQFTRKTENSQARARMTESTQRVFPFLQQRALDVSDTFTAQGLTNFIWALAKTQTSPLEELIPGLLATAEFQIKQFTPQLIANLMWSLAVLKIVPSEEFVNLITAQAMEVEKQFDPQNIANLIWAFVTLRITPQTALVNGLLGIATQRSKDFNPQEFANLMWSLASLGIIPPQPLLEALSTTAISRTSEFDPQSLSNLIWTFATFGIVPSPSLLDAMSRVAQEQATRINPQYTSNILWSFAKLKVQPPAPMLATLSRTLIDKAEFSPQIISNTIWAFATLNIAPSTDLVDALWAATMVEYKNFGHQATSTLFWSFATLKIPLPPAMIKVLSEQTIFKILEYTPQSLTNTLRAFPALHMTPSDELLQAITRQVLRTIADFDHRTVPSLSWAYASLGITPPMEITVELFRKARLSVDHFNSYNLVTLLWAFSEWEFKPGFAVIEALTMAVLRRTEDIPFSGLVTLAASLKQLGVVNFTLFAAMSKTAMKKSDTASLNEISVYLRRLSALAALDPPVAQYFASQIVARRKELLPEDISGLLGVLGTRADVEFVQTLSDEALLQVDAFSTYDICLLFDAFAKANYRPNEKLVHAFVNQLLVAERLGELKLAHYALLLKSLSIVGASPGRAFVQKMVPWVLERRDGFTGRSLGNYFHALITLKLFHPSDLRGLAPTVIHLRKNLRPSQVITLTRALTIGLKEPNQDLLVALCKQTIRKAGFFSTVQIAIIFRLLGQLDALSPRIVEELFVEIQRRKNLLSVGDLRQLLQAFRVTRYVPSPGVIAAITDAAIKREEDFSDEQCFEVIQSFSQLGLTPHPALLAAMSKGLNTRRAIENSNHTSLPS